MRTILIGAVEGTDAALQAMQAAGHPPAILATFAPEEGRRRHVDYVDLAPLAGPETRVIAVENVNDPDFLAEVEAARPDYLFVIGWSQLVGSALRALARRGAIGFHPTALPRMRGRAPIAWTILSGATESGISLFLIDDGADTGAILAQTRFPLSPRETAASLVARNKAQLGPLLRDLLPRLADGSATPVPQDEREASYCARRTAEDARIDWHRPAEEIDRLIRAQGPPYGGAFTFTRKRRVTIWEAEPIASLARYFAHEGQIVRYDEGRPVVLCGGGTLLRIDRHGFPAGADEPPLAGQIRFRQTSDPSSEPAP